MYAIIETGGKQLKVEEGQVIYVEKLDVEEGKEYTRDDLIEFMGVSPKVWKEKRRGSVVWLDYQRLWSERWH